MAAHEGLILEDEACAIAGAAMEAPSTLGPGFLEGLYADALALLHPFGAPTLDGMRLVMS